jgi:hypothetical protein
MPTPSPLQDCEQPLFRCRAAAFCALWEHHLAALLPALGIWRGQMLTSDPIARVFEYLAPQTFGVLNLIVHGRIIGVNISRDNLWEEETTPGHSFCLHMIED